MPGGDGTGPFGLGGCGVPYGLRARRFPKGFWRFRNAEEVPKEQQISWLKAEKERIEQKIKELEKE